MRAPRTSEVARAVGGDAEEMVPWVPARAINIEVLEKVAHVEEIKHRWNRLIFWFRYQWKQSLFKSRIVDKVNDSGNCSVVYRKEGGGWDLSR